MRAGLGLVASLLIVFVTAAIGGIASAQAGAFYAELVRLAWAPPAGVFAPAWTTLYLLMAVAAWLVWRDRGLAGARHELLLYACQLVLNALWTWIFFAWRQGTWAFFEILGLWILILATLLAFWRVRPLAGALLLPYLGWVSFATALTWAAWQRNPALLG